MQKIEAQIKIGQTKDGIIRSDTLTDFLGLATSVEMSMNMNGDTLGAPQIRRGLSQYSTAPFTNILSSAVYSQNSSATRQVLVQDGTKIYSINTGTPNTATLTRTLTTTGKARYTQFLNYTYLVNGNAGDPVQTFNGSTWGTTNVDQLPKGDYIATYSSLVWIADNSTDKLYYTNIPTLAGLVTGGTSYVAKLSPQDGESITALQPTSSALLVFKQNHIYRVYSEQSADPYPAYFVGTYSQESVVEGRDAVYFHHSSGFYKFVGGTQPVPISQRIQELTNAIPRSQYSKVFAWVEDEHIHWYIGDITVTGVTYKNCVLRYTSTQEIWTLYSYAFPLTSATIIDAPNGITHIVTQATEIDFTDNVYSDVGKPIHYDLITRWTTCVPSTHSLKAIHFIAVQHEGLGGSNMQMQVDNENPDVWETLGSLDNTFSNKLVPRDRTFNRVRFRLSGNINTSATGKKSRLIQIEIPSVTDYGVK